MNKDIFVVDGARTPFGSFGGSFKDVSAIDLVVDPKLDEIGRGSAETAPLGRAVIGGLLAATLATGG